MGAAGPAASMPAIALDISGLYLGTGFAAAIGGLVVDVAGSRYVPLAGGVLMAASFLLTPRARDAATADVSS